MKYKNCTRPLSNSIETPQNNERREHAFTKTVSQDVRRIRDGSATAQTKPSPQTHPKPQEGKKSRFQMLHSNTAGSMYSGTGSKGAAVLQCRCWCWRMIHTLIEQGVIIPVLSAPADACSVCVCVCMSWCVWRKS